MCQLIRQQLHLSGLLLSLSFATAAISATDDTTKDASALYPPELIVRARENARTQPWAAEMRDRLVRAAQPWMKLSDEHLWNLMFGNTIKRSWMVWSNGHCPSCKKDVPMYNWVMAPLQDPWKTRCPHCRELFPKNDFEKFYKSGLDEHNVFDPSRADRKLLFNAEHPDPADPLHTFGVDDGEGFVQEGKRWRFIGAYLIYGQWKKAIVDGIVNLSAAYAVTGDRMYAHKAGVLLDRVADLYPTFDFGKEGVMYEGPPLAGYVSTWHDACWEVEAITIAYDQVFDGLQGDVELVRFLGAKAAQFRPPLPKKSVAEIRRNIEQRILIDTLNNRQKIRSNYPTTDNAIITIRTVLCWPGNRDEILAAMDDIIKVATAVDGVTGEKGLDGYAVIGPHTIAKMLGRYARADAGFLAEMLKRHPRLHDMFRFHIDTWCVGRYYPRTGDTGSFAVPHTSYAGVPFSRDPGLEPSGFTFLWDLYCLTKDVDFARVLWRANGDQADGLPYDLFARDPQLIQHQVAELIEKQGPELRTPSVNKEQWHLAILRSGEGGDARAVWLDYDSGERHGHADAMNLGFFARGLDLMPDFGYPPVQYGGWGSPRATWYTQSIAHNTVVIDGRNSKAGAGRSILWVDASGLKAVRAEAPAIVDAKRFERTAVLVDVPPRGFYVVDVFRVAGGREHTRYLRSHYSQLEVPGLAFKPQPDVMIGQMRNFALAAAPQTPWTADFAIDDRQKLLTGPGPLHMRSTELTTGPLDVMTAESWVNARGFEGAGECWIPTLMVRRQTSAESPLSTFASVIHLGGQVARVESVRRIPLSTDGHVAIEVSPAGGIRDLLVAADVEEMSTGTGIRPLASAEAGLETDAELAFVREGPGGDRSVYIAKGSFVRYRGLNLLLKAPSELLHAIISGGTLSVATGRAEDVADWSAPRGD